MKTEQLLCKALLVVLLLAGCSAPPKPPDQQTAGRPKVASVYAYGIIEARHHSTLSAKFPGKLEEILVKEGDVVQRGQLRARFESRELEAQLAAARADVRVAEATLAEARAGFRPQEITEAEEQYKAAVAQLTKTELDWQRDGKLHSDGVLAASDWDQTKMARDQAEAAHNAAQARLNLVQQGTRPETLATLTRRLELARARVGQAEAALANAQLTAPFNGTITRKHREEGEAMDIGLPVLDISTLDDRYVRTEIDETDLGKIRLGQQTTISATGFPDLCFTGQVTAIRQQMGRKQLIPTDPAKIVDYKVLEIEVSLPAECPFPIKLPVDVRIALE